MSHGRRDLEPAGGTPGAGFTQGPRPGPIVTRHRSHRPGPPGSEAAAAVEIMIVVSQLENILPSFCDRPEAARNSRKMALLSC